MAMATGILTVTRMVIPMATRTVTGQHPLPSVRRNRALRCNNFMTTRPIILPDVVPPTLSEIHLANSRIVPTRDHILPLMPKGGICAEVGTQTGGFAKSILSILRPSKLHIYDISYNVFDHAHFATAIQKGIVELHQGDSSTLLGTLPDRHFCILSISTVTIPMTAS